MSDFIFADDALSIERNSSSVYREVANEIRQAFSENESNYVRIPLDSEMFTSESGKRPKSDASIIAGLRSNLGKDNVKKRKNLVEIHRDCLNV